jgi:TRAP-type C4-dicarboxylate transport system permease large subunit
MCLYAVCRVAKMPFETMVHAIIPFYIPLLVVLIIITFFPGVVMLLPNMIK